MAAHVLTYRLPVIDANGDPVNGGTIEFYEPGGSSTAKNVYSNKNLSASVGSSVDTNSLGMPENSGTAITVYGDGAYYVIFKDASGNQFDDFEWVSEADSSLTNIAALKLLEGGYDGQLINVKGYYDVGDGGGGEFYWDASSTDTENDGTIIKVTGVTTGRWKRIYSGAERTGLVSVAWFGAVADGSTDDSTALQKAVDSAFANGWGGVYFPAGDYACSDVKIYSRQTYMGDGYKQTNLVSNDDAPVLVSANWRQYNGAGPQGTCQIKALRVTGQGSDANTSEVGILIRDYYSTVEGVWVLNCGSNGIRFDLKNQSGSVTGGTLVENRLRDIECFNNYGDGISYGDDDNNALTDAHFDNIIVNVQSGFSNYGINVGSSAGCQVNQVHVYGTPVLDGIRLANCFNTNVNGIYVENATNVAFSAPKFQKHLNASNLSLGAEGGTGLLVSSGGAASNDVANITNVNYRNQSASLAGVAVTSGSGAKVRVVNLTTQTSGGTVSDSSGTNISIVSDIDYRDGSRTISFDGGQFDVALAYRKAVTAAGAQSFDFVIRVPYTYSGAIGTVNIGLRSFWNGGARVQYTAMLTVLTKDSGDAPAVLLTPVLSTGAEFTTLPAVSTSATGPGDITVTLTFEPSNTDARGVVGLTMANA